MREGTRSFQAGGVVERRLLSSGDTNLSVMLLECGHRVKGIRLRLATRRSRTVPVHRLRGQVRFGSGGVFCLLLLVMPLEAAACEVEGVRRKCDVLMI
jgi:hypothetical protein